MPISKETKDQRASLIRSITLMHEGAKDSGAPTMNGKPRKLTHLKLFVIDREYGEREIWPEQVRKESIISDIIGTIINFAREHAFPAHKKGESPRYFLRDYYGTATAVHEWDLAIEPPTGLMVDPGPSPQRTDRAREGALFESVLRFGELALNDGFRRTELAMTTMERALEREQGVTTRQGERIERMSDRLEIAEDKKLERDIRMANENLRLQVKGAIYQQGVAFLPAFAGIAHKWLGTQAGIQEDKPLSAEIEEFIARVADLPADETLTIINKVFATKTQRDDATLMVQRYRGRRQIKQLDRAAVAAQDGVTRPVSHERLTELARRPANEPGRPSPFR